MKTRDEVMAEMMKMKTMLDGCGFRSEIILNENDRTLSFCLIFQNKRVIGLPQEFDDNMDSGD